MYPIKVAIIGDGHSGIQSRDKYWEQAEMYARGLNRAMVQDGHLHVNKFDAKVMPSAELALKGHLSSVSPRRILIFISNTFLRQAKELAVRHQKANLRVVLITGLIPADEVLLLPKADLGTDTLCEILG